MDTVLLFALPLVGGLLFCDAWNVTRYRAAREEGHRLYFRAVLYGSLLFAVAFTLRLVLLNFSLYADFDAYLRASIKPLAKEALSGDAVAALSLLCFAAMLISWPLAKAPNLFFSKRAALKLAIAKDDFEDLLFRGMTEEFPIEVSMADGKVYVGYVVSSFDPRTPRKNFSILPLVSGYRDKDSKQVKFTTYYTSIYDSVDEDQQRAGPLGHLRPEHFVTVLPIEGIGSSRRFDFAAYGAFTESPKEREDNADKPSEA